MLKCWKHWNGNTWNAKEIFCLNERRSGNMPCWVFEEPIFYLLDFLQLEKMILGSDLNRSLWNLFCPCSKLYLLSESHISVGLWKQLFILVGKGPGLKNVPDRNANNTQYSLLAATGSHWESYRLLKYWVGMLWLPWENNVQVGCERYNLLPSLHEAPCQDSTSRWWAVKGWAQGSFPAWITLWSVRRAGREQ